MVTSVASLTGNRALVHTVRTLPVVKCWVVCSDILNRTFRLCFSLDGFGAIHVVYLADPFHIITN